MADILHPKIYNVDRYLLSVLMHKPNGKGPFPVVVILPGFTDGKDEPHLVAVAEFLADNGYLTVHFDPAGIGESEGTVEEDYRISIILNDLDTILTFLSHQDYVIKEKKALWGSSMGGMLAIIYGAEYPSTVQAICAVSPPSFIGSSAWLKEEIPNWEKTGKLEIEHGKNDKITVPDAFLRESRKYSALTSAKSLKQPFLMVTGAADDVVSPEDSKQIFDAVLGTKKHIEMPEMGHEYFDNQEQITKINKATKTFFDDYLK